jgi:hypothetical protein
VEYNRTRVFLETDALTGSSQVTGQAGAVYPCVLGSIYFVTQVELVTGSLRPTPTPSVTTHSLDYFDTYVAINHVTDVRTETKHQLKMKHCQAVARKEV